MKQQINEITRMQKLAGMISESQLSEYDDYNDDIEAPEYEDLGQGDDQDYDKKDHIYNTFKEWLEGLIERHGNEKKGSLGVAAQIKRLTKGNMDATPEDFIAEMKRWGSGSPRYINFYSTDDKIIAKGTYPYGEWDLTNETGTVHPASNVTPSKLIYPDAKPSSGYDFNRSMEEVVNKALEEHRKQK